MSAIANKRKLLEAVNALVKASKPDLPEMQTAAGALAQVFSDILGVDVTLVMRMDAQQMTDAIALADALEKR
ncbi:TPA: hypothetical protein QDB28_004048 [Burkholderia vietnamiensis]|nr:hypothetical protein [Burkholderia vietnamiensis]